jgi:hypothetical protein
VSAGGREPADILYSLPTVCDPVPPIDVSADESRRLVLHEDDWRAVELVDGRLADVVVRQFERIRDVVRHHARRGPTGMLVGFDAVHVRRDPAEPLPGAPSRGALPDPVGGPAGAVGFFGEPGAVPGSFAVPLGPGVLYGLADGDAVRVLGLELEPAPSPAPAGALAALMSAHGLHLVDWCRTLLVDPDGVEAYVAARCAGSAAAEL